MAAVSFNSTFCSFAASVKSVQFTPDAAALQSILQNEGVKAAGPVDASSRTSACPSGRGTSVYMVRMLSVLFWILNCYSTLGR